jgi:hypothetical protein
VEKTDMLKMLVVEALATKTLHSWSSMAGFLHRIMVSVAPRCEGVNDAMNLRGIHASACVLNFQTTIIIPAVTLVL